jgi:hypothetical protein
MRNFVLGALVLVTAACGAYSFPGGSPLATGTVTGTVTVFPCGIVQPIHPVQPVQPVQPDQPQDSIACKMSPAARVEMDFASGDRVASTLTDSNGRYRIELPEGTYRVSAKGYKRIVSGPAAVTVKAGGTVNADYVFDSGMRRAVPQQ